MQINPRLAFAVTVILVVTAYLSGQSNIGTQNSDEVDQENSRLARLEQEVRSLSSALNLLMVADSEKRSALKAGLVDLRASLDRGLSSNNFKAEEDYSEEPIKEKNSGLPDYQESLRLSDLQKKYLDDVFNQEAVDDVWANDATLKLGEVFLKPELQKSQVANVDCRSSLCRIDFSIDKMNINEESNYDNHMLMELTSSFTGGVQLRRTRNPDGSVTMVAYAAKNGSKIPQYQAGGGLGQ